MVGQIGPRREAVKPVDCQRHPTWNRYAALPSGEVFGIRGQMSAAEHHTGYMVVTISVGESRHVQYRIHRFIWECFNGLIPEDKVIDHIDGDKKNNRLDNLRLASITENNLYARKMHGDFALKGSALPQAKLNENQVREIIIQTKQGLSNDQIASNFGINFKHVSLIRNRKRWKHVWEEIDYEENLK